jgi:hypothetical protein
MTSLLLTTRASSILDLPVVGCTTQGPGRGAGDLAAVRYVVPLGWYR